MVNISELTKHFPSIDNGLFESRVKGVRLFKETQTLPRQPRVYDPGICIVIQGSKIGYLGGRKFHYDANQYLVTTVTMPFESEVFSSPEEPLLGMFIDIDMGQLHDLIALSEIPGEVIRKGEKVLPCGIGPAEMDENMADAILRLLKCLNSESDAHILGPGLVREILYRALKGSQAPVLYSLAMHSGSFSQVARVLRIMQSSYADKLDVEQLANNAHMSVSAFHRAFKEVTSDSPMQYLKKIRLSKARDIIVQENEKAYVAADRVGYESPSQFSREFKRYLGKTPADILRESKVS